MSHRPRPSTLPGHLSPVQRRSLRRPPVDPALAALPASALVILFQSARRAYREAYTPDSQAHLFSLLAELSRRGLTAADIEETRALSEASTVRHAA